MRNEYAAPQVTETAGIRFETALSNSSPGPIGHWEFQLVNGFWKRIWVTG